MGEACRPFRRSKPRRPGPRPREFTGWMKATARPRRQRHAGRSPGQGPCRRLGPTTRRGGRARWLAASRRLSREARWRFILRTGRRRSARHYGPGVCGPAPVSRGDGLDEEAERSPRSAITGSRPPAIGRGTLAGTWSWAGQARSRPAARRSAARAPRWRHARPRPPARPRARLSPTAAAARPRLGSG